MKFVVPRVSLIRLLKACGAPHPLLRIEASEGVVTLSCGNIDAGCEAIIESPGVCFLRHFKLKKLLQTYFRDAEQSDSIEVVVAPRGIWIGRTHVTRAGLEISLFDNPEIAPRTLRFRSPFVPEEPPPVDLQMSLPLFPAGAVDTPLPCTPPPPPLP
ncbi:MAG: hypothetical protein ACKOF3_05345 [Spartobacteria bacterium]